MNFARPGFCARLTESTHASGATEGLGVSAAHRAQWGTRAARATTATAFGDRLSSKQANFRGKPYNGAEEGPSLQRTCGWKQHERVGIHDMHGNVYEWCDWYHSRLPGGGPRPACGEKLRDGRTATSRGSAGADATRMKAAAGRPFRLRFEPERRHGHIGFRIVAVRP
jgi:formylglycine-generating enzyme required for sulfatase activity